MKTSFTKLSEQKIFPKPFSEMSKSISQSENHNLDRTRLERAPICLRIPTVQIEEIGILAPTPCHRRLGLVCPFGGYGQPMPHTFGGTKPHGPWWHCGCMPAAPKQQKNAKIKKTPKNSQVQGPSGKKVLAPATNCKNWPGTLVGMP